MDRKYKLSELSEKFNIDYNTLYSRLFTYNITIEDAIKNVSFQGKRNKKAFHLLTYNGKTKNIKEWSKDSNMNYATLFMRIRNGWKIKDALTIPVRNKNAII